MQTPTLDDAKLILIIVALVAAVREQFPKVDGKAFIYAVAALLGVGLCFLIGGDTVRNTITHGLLLAMTAVGGMHVVGYHATKSAGGDGSSDVAVAPDGGMAAKRGFVRTSTLLWMAAVALVALSGIAVLCSGCGASKAEIKSVVDETKAVVEEICSPADPTLDACIDKLLSSPRYVAAKKKAAARRALTDGDAGVGR